MSQCNISRSGVATGGAAECLVYIASTVSDYPLKVTYVDFFSGSPTATEINQSSDFIVTRQGSEFVILDEGSGEAIVNSSTGITSMIEHYDGGISVIYCILDENVTTANIEIKPY